MAKGENIFKRKDGRWEARYIKGYELSGKIKYGYCYGKSYKEAKEKVSNIKAALINGQTISEKIGRRRLSFYCDEWLWMNQNRVKEATYVKYYTILERHIKPKLGECVPTGITGGLIEAFSREMLYKDGLSPKTTKDILIVLKSVLTYIEKQHPGMCTAVDIVYPRESPKEMRVLSHEEQRRFTRYLLCDMDTCKFGILLALCTGIRIGELCALRWEAISLWDQTIRITSTMQRLKDTQAEGSTKTRVIIGSPKSDTSARTIPMTEQIMRLCSTMDPGNPAAFVLTGTDRHMEPRTLQYRLAKYTGECGLEGVHFHTLRHTFATRCVEVGFELKSLSEILGHSTTTITLDRYVHSSMSLKRDNMNKLSVLGI